MDPKLALSLFVSMEEVWARQDTVDRRDAMETTTKDANEGHEHGASSHDVTIAETTTSGMVETTQRGPNPMVFIFLI